MRHKIHGTSNIEFKRNQILTVEMPICTWQHLPKYIRCFYQHCLI